MGILLFILIIYIKQRPMEKINLSVQRSFSDLITVTINFMKQEFVPFIRDFADAFFHEGSVDGGF